ncbi:hypothetical protein HTS88_12020 [Pseudarthrobacter oxydans]|uniref:hypothetical protein n=1 Tax=Pseudarthrobacter oxydans TaxID=1671 RepID=UPI001571AB1D|nr:hypothetical protein [Pseudarthrobacter oxydans]NSX37132.1 hypothetical protein [Pseudarthrobacter oxydans]
MSLTEWADDLAYTLRNSGHGMEQITLASVEDPKSGELVIETARRTAALSGWPVIEISAKDLRQAAQLPRHGYIIVNAGSGRLAPEVPTAVAAFQHLVGEDLQVALLVLGAPKVIQALRREPALGWLSRTFPLDVLSSR